MEEKEIFELILKADDALKYATEERIGARSRQAREYLTEARDQALAIGNQGLVEQAERRLADLESLPGADAGL